MKCPKCGARVSAQAHFCSKCGAAVASPPAEEKTNPTPEAVAPPPADAAATGPEVVHPKAKSKPAHGAEARIRAPRPPKPARRGSRLRSCLAVLLLVSCAGLVALARSDELQDWLQGIGPAETSLEPWEPEASDGRADTEAFVPPPPTATPAPIAEMTIGPEGGVLDVPNALRVEFPAGALAGSETIVIRQLADAPNVGGFYAVERPPNSPPLAVPARVTFVLPAGTTPEEVVVAQEAGESRPEVQRVLRVIPFESEADTNTVTAAVDHFSTLSWIYKVVIQGGAAFSIGTVLVAYLAGGPSTWVAAFAYVAVGLSASGAGGADWLNDRLRQWGLDQGFMGPHVQVFWTNKGEHAVNDLSRGLAYDFDASGHLVNVSDYQRKELGDPLSPYDEPPPEGLTRNIVPRHVLELLSELETAHDYYQNQTGYELPDDVWPLKVLIHRGVGKSDGLTNDGLWDGDYLNINADAMTDARAMNRKGTVAHEFWHFTSDAGMPIDGRWEIMNECLAVAFENEVFPVIGTPDIQRLPQDDGLQLSYGLLGGPTNQEAGVSGYYLWPWCKYLLHRTDPDQSQIRALLRNGISDEALTGWFAGFTRALLTRERALGPVEASIRKDGTIVSVPSGWDQLRLEFLWQGLKRTIQLGRNPLEDLPWGRQPVPMPPAGPGIVPGEIREDKRSTSHPLSFSLLKLNMTSPATDNPLLVIRREKLDPLEEIIALSPDGQRFPDRTTEADLVVAKGGVAVPADRVTGQSMIPLALVGFLTTESDPTPLLAYFLRPPATLGIMPNEPDDPPGAVRLAWPLADLGSDLVPKDALAGYRFVLEFEGHTEFAMAEDGSDLLVDPAENSAVIESLPQSYTRLGILSEDAVMRGEDGQTPLRSEVAWIEQAAGLTLQIVEGAQLGAEVPQKSDPQFVELIQLTDPDLFIRVEDREGHTIESPAVHCSSLSGCTLQIPDLDPAQIDRLYVVWTNLPQDIAGREGAASEYVIWPQKYAGVPEWEAMLQQRAGTVSNDAGRMELTDTAGKLTMMITVVHN